MSKASEWAKRLCEAELIVSQIRSERPNASPSFYVSLLGKTYFGVSWSGRPMIFISGHEKPYEIHFGDDTRNLIAAARWILDTFGGDQG